MKNNDNINDKPQDDAQQPTVSEVLAGEMTHTPRVADIFAGDELLATY